MGFINTYCFTPWSQGTGWGKWNCTFTISTLWYRAICKHTLSQAVCVNEHLGSGTQRPHRASGTNERTEWKWLFHIFSQFQDSLHYILLEVWQQEFLSLFRVWNWEWRGQRKKPQVTLWSSKWVTNRMPNTWEMRQLGQDRRTMSQPDSAWRTLLKSETKW